MPPATPFQTNLLYSFRTKFSLRDRRILAKLAELKNPKVQAKELGLTVATIYKAHRRIEQRFGLKSPVEFYEFAKPLNYVKPGGPVIGMDAAPSPRLEYTAPGVSSHGALAGAVARVLLQCIQY